jgi:hypothetical protein
VARVIRGSTTERFRADLAACGVVQGTAVSRAVGATIAALSEAETLPESGDSTLLREPDERGIARLVHIRRVPGHQLWVWYRLNRAGDVVLLQLTARLPR